MSFDLVKDAKNILKHLDVIKGAAAGKTIQIKNMRAGEPDEWITTCYLLPDLSPSDYRIKPDFGEGVADPNLALRLLLIHIDTWLEQGQPASTAPMVLRAVRSIVAKALTQFNPSHPKEG